MAAPVVAIGLLCVLLWTPIYGYSSGPPISICDSLSPSHGASAQSSSPPYSIDMASLTTYTPGSRLSVTIKSTGSGTVFKGIALQARKKGTTEIVGVFESVPSGFKPLTCQGIASNTVTHANGNDKTDQVFLWKAPDTNVGEIEFVATIVQTKRVFWMGIKSNALPASGGTTSTTSATTTTPSGGTTTTPSGGTTTTGSTTTTTTGSTTTSNTTSTTTTDKTSHAAPTV